MPPQIIYQTGNLRVVLRDRDRYPEGYVEIEEAHRDALDGTSWHYLDSLPLEYDKQTGHPAIKLFIALMRERVPGLK